MKDKRPGEQLWSEWDGDDYQPAGNGSLIYWTIEHVDMDNEVVKRALASTLQRDGAAVSLWEGFKLQEGATIVQGYVGLMDGEGLPTACDENGETRYGDVAENVEAATWVEIG